MVAPSFLYYGIDMLPAVHTQARVNVYEDINCKTQQRQNGLFEAGLFALLILFLCTMNRWCAFMQMWSKSASFDDYGSEVLHR